MVSEEKTFEMCGWLMAGQTTDRRVCLYYELTFEPKGSGELTRAVVLPGHTASFKAITVVITWYLCTKHSFVSSFVQKIPNPNHTSNILSCMPTLKKRSRSLNSNQLKDKSQCYINTNLMKIHESCLTWVHSLASPMMTFKTGSMSPIYNQKLRPYQLYNTKFNQNPWTNYRDTALESLGHWRAKGTLKLYFKSVDPRKLVQDNQNLNSN